MIFPSSIDRNHFGSWLSGFTDGEGCFRLCAGKFKSRKYRKLCATFTINLRRDDKPILHLIQSYLDCGLLHNIKCAQRGQRKPLAAFTVCDVRDLKDKIITHFDHFPLLAKKRNDFVIWSLGVELIYKVVTRPRVSYGTYGLESKWRDEEIKEFLSLEELLRYQREYRDTE